MQAKTLLVFLAAPGFALPVMAGPPSTPANLSLLQYSQSTAELFWERSTDTDRIKGYELLTSDGSQWLGDVTSHLDTRLPTDGDRIYQVVAVDSFGNRSTPSLPVALLSNEVSETNTSIDSCVSSSTGGSSSCTASSSSQSGVGVQPDVEVTPNINDQQDITPTQGDIIQNQAIAEGNPPIGNLRAEVYSETALELFWDRPSSSPYADEYQIHRTGRHVNTTNGTSYFDSGLNGGTLYQYEIILIKDGVSRATRNIDVRTRGTSDNSTSSSSQSDGRNTSNVYGETYSSSAVELFWNTTANVEKFDIYRNGEYLGSFNVMSYYDDLLQADTNYRYEVYAHGAENFLLGNVQLRTSR